HSGGGTVNILSLDKKIAVISALVEGNSIRSIERMTGVHRDTIMRLILDAGDRCGQLLNERIRRVGSKRVQVDEIWTFLSKKQARVSENDPEEFGDQYVFVAMDADTKLVISHLVGKREAATALGIKGSVFRCCDIVKSFYILASQYSTV